MGVHVRLAPCIILPNQPKENRATLAINPPPIAPLDPPPSAKFSPSPCRTYADRLRALVHHSEGALPTGDGVSRGTLNGGRPLLGRPGPCPARGGGDGIYRGARISTVDGHGPLAASLDVGLKLKRHVAVVAIVLLDRSIPVVIVSTEAARSYHVMVVIHGVRHMEAVSKARGGGGGWGQA